MGSLMLCARFLALLSLLPWCFSTEIVGERSLDISASVVMQLSQGVQVQDSPGKPGKSMACERVHIHGLSRIKYLSKFAHSGTVKVSPRNITAYAPNAEVCFHRNASLAIGMCSEDQWEKISKGSWVRHMSPFDYKILDIRTASSSLERYEVSVEEDFYMHRVILLVSGIILFSAASFLSKSLVFYYGSAMAVGIILVILVVLFQGMKLVPFGGRKLAFFIPSSIAGFAFLLKQIAPGFLRSILVFVGLDEEMYDPVVKFLLAFVILAGAWMGFWVVRKLFVTEDGSIDTSTSHFVLWSIRILALLMISQSSVDPVLATEAIVSGIVVSSLLRRIFKLRFLRRVIRKSMKLFKRARRKASLPDRDSDSSDVEETFDEFAYGLQSNGDFNTMGRQRRNLTPASIKSPYHGLGQRSPVTPVVAEDTGLYLSSFHSTPQRRRFSKQGWEKFTADSTQRGLDELASSPGFGKWLHQNANRISVTPEKAERTLGKWVL